MYWAELEGSDPGREALDEINLLPGRERREMICVLIGHRAVSFYALTAFVFVVNSSVLPGHAFGLKAALDQAQALFENHRHIWLTAAKGHWIGT